MPLSAEKKEFFDSYRKEKLKRVPLDVTHEMYASIKENAEEAEMSVNGYIKSLIAEDTATRKIERIKNKKNLW